MYPGWVQSVFVKLASTLSALIGEFIAHSGTPVNDVKAPMLLSGTVQQLACQSE